MCIRDRQSGVDSREKQARGNFSTDAEFRQALKENGFGTVEEWRKMQLDAARRSKLQQEVMQKLPVSYTHLDVYKRQRPCPAEQVPVLDQ